ncbi:hypothetical protein V9K67_03310 [Paraflavisolibacter sp. H34]|uniref:hypothetical protein n=1 Tax=Huijunlia imazamoxiresistens TaxID=3127457 RepID=UPI00301B1825
MIALFKQKSPANIILLLIFGMLIKLPVFFTARNIVATDQDGKLYHYFLSLFAGGGGNGFTCAFIAFLLLYSQAMMVNYLVNEQRMTTRQTFLPAMSYLLITSLLPEWNILSAPLVAATLIIWAFIRLFRLYNLPIANGPVFNLGLLMGISSFIYFPSAAFACCMILGLLILRPFRVNDLILLVLGVLTPYYFYAVYLFLSDRLLLENLFPQVRLQVPALKRTVWLTVSAVLLAVPFFLGGYYVQVHLRKMLIQVRKNWALLLLYLLLALLVPFINTENSFHNWVLVAAPFAAFHASAYLYPQRRHLPTLLFALTLCYILYQQYGTTMWR